MRSLLCAVLLTATAFAQQTATPANPTMQSTAETREAGMVTIPAGTEIPLTLSQAISTRSARPGDPVYAQTAFPFTINDQIVIPAGTYVQGRIAEVKRPGRVKGRAQLLMHFTTLIYRSGYTVMLPGAVEQVPGADKQEVTDKEGTVQQAGSKTDDVKTVGKVAATGAGLGGIAGRSAKGLGIGGAAGAATGLGWVLLTRGPDMTLPVGTSVQMVIQRDMHVKAAKID